MQLIINEVITPMPYTERMYEKFLQIERKYSIYFGHDKQIKLHYYSKRIWDRFSNDELTTDLATVGYIADEFKKHNKSRPAEYTYNKYGAVNNCPFLREFDSLKMMIWKLIDLKNPEIYN